MSQSFAQNGKPANEPLVISQVEDGFRVFAPSLPTVSYIVSGSRKQPVCSCQKPSRNPTTHCQHIHAVLAQVASQPTTQPSNLDPDDAEERRAIQEEARATKGQKRSATNGSTQMLLKRSVSPDGRIDSLSVEFACPVGQASIGEIKTKALNTLKLQTEIVKEFLGNRPVRPQPPIQPTNGNGAVPAQILTVGGMDGKWGRRLFFNIQVNGNTLKYFGSQKQLGEALTAAGYSHLASDVAESVQFNLPCQAITAPSTDGKYVNVEKLLPPQSGPGGWS